MEAVRLGKTEVVSLLVKAGAALDLQNKVNMWHTDPITDMSIADYVGVGVVGV